MRHQRLVLLLILCTVKMTVSNLYADRYFGFNNYNRQGGVGAEWFGAPYGYSAGFFTNKAEERRKLTDNLQNIQRQIEANRNARGDSHKTLVDKLVLQRNAVDEMFARNPRLAVSLAPRLAGEEEPVYLARVIPRDADEGDNEYAVRVQQEVLDRKVLREQWLLIESTQRQIDGLQQPDANLEAQWQELGAKTLRRLNDLDTKKGFGHHLMQVLFPGIDTSEMVDTQELDANGQPVNNLPSLLLEAVALKGLDAGFKSFSNQVEQAIDNSLSGVLTNFFGLVSNKCYRIYIAFYKLLFGLLGMPFDTKELELLKQTAYGTLSRLDYIAKQFKTMGQRDKVSRDVEADEQGDPVWTGVEGIAGTRSLLAAELFFVSWVLHKHIPFYEKDSDQKIVFYARSMQKAIQHFITNVLNKTKSQKDLCSAANSTAILVLRESLDQHFDHLLSAINIYNDAPVKRKVRQDYGNMMNRRPGMMPGMNQNEDYQ